MIFYIHGFASSISNNINKIKQLESIFNESVIGIDYDSSLSANQIYKNMIKFVNDKLDGDFFQENLFIGTSLGGFWASILSQYFLDKAIMFNPCYDPSILLKQFEGHNINYGTKEEFELTSEVISSYNKYSSLGFNSKTIFIAEDDEIIPFKDSYDFYKNNSKVIKIKGGHQIQDFIQYTEKLKDVQNRICLWN